LKLGLIDASILTEEYAMEEQLNAQEKLSEEAKMSEVAEELSEVTLDTKSDDIAIEEESE